MGPLPRTMSVPDAGEWLGVGPTTARRLARIYRETGGAYGIPNIRVGHKLRVPGVLLAEYIAEDRITPPDFADELASRRRRDPAGTGDSDAVGSGGSVSSTRRLTVRRGSPSSGGRGRGGPAPSQLPLFPAG